MTFNVLSAALLGLFVVSCRAALSMSNIASECADASGYSTCYSQALGTAKTCYENNCEGSGTCTDENDCTASNPNCVTSCSCVAYADMIQCAVTHCWNMVLSLSFPSLFPREPCMLRAGASRTGFGPKTDRRSLPGLHMRIPASRHLGRRELPNRSGRKPTVQQRLDLDSLLSVPPEPAGIVLV